MYANTYQSLVEQFKALRPIITETRFGNKDVATHARLVTEFNSKDLYTQNKSVEKALTFVIQLQTSLTDDASSDESTSVGKKFRFSFSFGKRKDKSDKSDKKLKDQEKTELLLQFQSVKFLCQILMALSTYSRIELKHYLETGQNGTAPEPLLTTLSTHFQLLADDESSKSFRTQYLRDHFDAVMADYETHLEKLTEYDEMLQSLGISGPRHLVTQLLEQHIKGQVNSFLRDHESQIVQDTTLSAIIYYVNMLKGIEDDEEVMTLTKETAEAMHHAIEYPPYLCDFTRIDIYDVLKAIDEQGDLVPALRGFKLYVPSVADDVLYTELLASDDSEGSQDSRVGLIDRHQGDPRQFDVPDDAYSDYEPDKRVPRVQPASTFKSIEEKALAGMKLSAKSSGLTADLKEWKTQQRCDAKKRSTG